GRVSPPGGRAICRWFLVPPGAGSRNGEGGGMNRIEPGRAGAKAAPSAYVLTAVSWVLAGLGAAFYWWPPLGIVLSPGRLRAGLLAALIGLVRLPRPAPLRALLAGGLFLAVVALGVDLVAVWQGLDTVRFSALR